MLRTCLKRTFATRISLLYRIALPLGLILAVLVVIIYRCGDNCSVGSKVVVGVNVYDQASRAIKSATAAPCSADDSRRYLRNLVYTILFVASEVYVTSVFYVATSLHACSSVYTPSVRSYVACMQLGIYALCT